MDSTRDYIEAMAEAVRVHQREMAGMARTSEGNRNRLLSMRQFVDASLNRSMQMTALDALGRQNACVSPQWWAAQARGQTGAGTAV